MSFNLNNNRNIQRKSKWLLFAVPFILSFSGCKKLFEVPGEKEYISNKISYGTKFFEPILGRTTLMGSFNADNSTQPLTFSIVNARYGDGRPITDFYKTKEVWVWTGAYDGKEKTLEEINSKRKKELRPLLEVRASGQLILWSSATDDLIPARKTDSTNLLQDRRYFDVKVSNIGGEVIIKDLEFRLWRERPYEPSNDFNPYTGKIAITPADFLDPINKLNYIRPSRISNIIGKSTRKELVSNDVVVSIRPFSGGNGHSLRFRFLDKNAVVINPAKFNETKWDQLVHGFNRQTTDEYVQYDVAYPIPLINIPTSYASGGRANVNFSYSRLGFGGIRQVGSIGLDFSIYREGDWEIVFQFRNDNPKFEDE
ncbi:DUF5007 domain-containing protein [Pedobacter nyackensis]|uniref:DUF5007 domain-containing protein n=1 Tax=Pedobacter nyackensis TaxID=475255 RepID=A0A1W2CQM4_9SPHI|nr:DUF5007 domain-containing protein [Pedobacter nyackensis]SMC87276.1 protein of unknown function [Pedobacter nyackensis]